MQKFSEIKYVRPDLGALKKQAGDCIRRLKKAASAGEADAALKDVMAAVEEAGTMYVVANIRNTANTKDAFYEGEMKFFNRAMPMLMPLLKKGISALLSSPYRKDLEEKYGAQMFRNLEMQRRNASSAIILPSIKENNLTTLYSKTAAACSVEFMGEKCNFYGLLRHMQSTDRAERKAAFEAWAKLYEDVSPKLEAQYGKLVAVRRTIAKKLKYKDYIDYIYPSRGRYDYTAADVEAFRKAVLEHITPLCAEMYAAQARRLGQEKLAYYDEALFYPEGNPVPQGTPEELVAAAGGMYAELSPETDEFFSFMRQNELFDLVTRENKHLGGYCTELPSLKAPFIFSNFNGTSADVDVLTHEAGHAFQAYYAARRVPFMLLAGSTSEINEIHSMTMELFAYPYMDRFFGEDADRYRYMHFCEALRTIPYLVSVDEFQHKVFQNPGSGPADWRRFWKETEQKYMPWRTYDGNAFLESGGFWMQKQHIFMYPFYYVDYALAQLGAFSLYQKQTEGGDAWGSYLSLCGMGGQYGYFETLSRAGIPNPLRPETVRAAAEFVRRQADVLKQKA